MKALLYCCKNIPYINKYGNDITDYPDYVFDCEGINGKIAAECDYEVEEIIANDVNLYDEYSIKYTTKNGYSHIDDNFEALLDNSCLNAFELNDYLGGYGGYAIHIKNLKIFDESKKTSEYNTYNRNGKVHIADIPIYTAPQNMMYAFDYYGNPFVLISVRPELMCKILNGECTIIVKKKVLKEML